jgi:hypothetical protein
MKNSEVNYKEVAVPAGTFRMYDDRPNVWVEVPRGDGYANWMDRGAAMAAESEK